LVYTDLTCTIPRAHVTNAANTKVLVKDFSTKVVKLVLKCLLRSHDPAHMMNLSPSNDTKESTEFDCIDLLSGTQISLHKFSSVCHSFYLESFEL